MNLMLFRDRSTKHLENGLKKHKIVKNSIVLTCVKKSAKILFFTMVFTTVLPIFILIFSCGETAEFSPTKNEIIELDINTLTQVNKETDSALSGTRVTNLANETHKYTVVPLPQPKVADTTYILNLDNDVADLNTKGFFLVNGYFSDLATNIEDVVVSSPTTGTTGSSSQPLSLSHESPYGVDYQDTSEAGDMHSYITSSVYELKKLPADLNFSSNFINAAVTTGKEYYDTLTKIDIGDETVKPSEREFLFSLELHDNLKNLACKYGTATLYDKLEINYKGSTIRFAFWVEDKGYTYVKKIRTYELIEQFITMLYNSDDNKSLYHLLYTVNGNHVWGDHNLGDVAASSDAVINIAFGDISNASSENNKKGIIKAYVSSRVLFNPKEVSSGTFCSEKRVEPTLYMSKDFIPSVGRNEIAFHLTLVHELQHMFLNYTHIILRSSSIDAVGRNIPKAWLHELLAVSLEYLAGYKISELLSNNTGNDAKGEYKKYYDAHYMKPGYAFPSALFAAPITPTNGGKFTAQSYLVAFLLGSYLVQNYGIETIEKLAKTTARGRNALLMAVKNTKKYYEYGNKRPSTNEALLLAFFTSLFTSDVIEDRMSSTSGPFKMFALDSSKSTIAFKEDDLVYAELEQYQYKKMSLYIPSINVSATPENLENKRIQNTILVKGVFAIDFMDLWTNGRGPKVFISHYARYGAGENKGTKISMGDGKHSVMYLGGKIRKTRKDSTKPIGEGNGNGFSIGDDNKLILKIKLTKNTLANLVIVEYL